MSSVYQLKRDKCLIGPGAYKSTIKHVAVLLQTSFCGESEMGTPEYRDNREVDITPVKGVFSRRSFFGATLALLLGSRGSFSVAHADELLEGYASYLAGLIEGGEAQWWSFKIINLADNLPQVLALHRDRGSMASMRSEIRLFNGVEASLLCSAGANSSLYSCVSQNLVAVCGNKMSASWDQLYVSDGQTLISVAERMGTIIQMDWSMSGLTFKVWGEEATQEEYMDVVRSYLHDEAPLTFYGHLCDIGGPWELIDIGDMSPVNRDSILEATGVDIDAPVSPEQPPNDAVDSFAALASESFSDVSVEDWYAGWIGRVLSAGMMTGYEGSSLFGPEDTVTRGQVATVIWRAAGSPSPAYDAPFQDVSMDEFYGPAVAWCNEAGVVTGYDGLDIFGPDDLVTREQLATMLWRRAGSPSAAGCEAFPDYEMISLWAEEALSWCLSLGIITGDGATGCAMPLSSATRGQLAKILSVWLGL